MAKIYVSSTYSDLKEYRERVDHVLRQLGHDVIAMENYVATDKRPLDKCLNDVGRSDVYVGIFAWRYGYVPTKDNPAHRSITELEFRHAKENNIACLLFLLDETAPWPHIMMEKGEGESRIASLREELSGDYTVSFFRDPENLAALVTASVTQWEKARSQETMQSPPERIKPPQKQAPTLQPMDIGEVLTAKFNEMAAPPEGKIALAIFLFYREVVINGIAGKMYKKKIGNADQFAMVSEDYLDDQKRKCRYLRKHEEVDGRTINASEETWTWEKGEWVPLIESSSKL